MASPGCASRWHYVRARLLDGAGSGAHRSRASCCGSSSSCLVRCSTRPPDVATLPGIETPPRGSSGWMDCMLPPFTRKATMNRKSNGVGRRTVVSVALLGALVGAARPHPDAPSQVSVRLSEWKVELSQASVAAGTVTFVITNAGNIPHGFEVEGKGIEKEIERIQPGASDTLTLTLKPGTYEVYCPVGDDSHKKLGMETHLKVAGASSSGSSGYGGPDPSGLRRRARRARVAGEERPLLEQRRAHFRLVHVHGVGQGRHARLGGRRRRVHHPGRRALEAAAGPGADEGRATSPAVRRRDSRALLPRRDPVTHAARAHDQQCRGAVGGRASVQE